MSVNTQVSGNKQLNVQPSKNLGTVINTEVSGNSREGKYEYRKITDVQPTQVSGEVHNTNYMGINDEGMDIRAAKKITGNELNVQTYPTAYDAKKDFIADANEEIARQEADKKSKGYPDLTSIEITHAPTKVNYVEGQDFDTAGMVVVANYDTGASKVITDYTITGGENLTTTTTKVTISYSQGSVVKTAEQAITVVAKALASIEVTTDPTKVSYIAGEYFDPTGIEVTAIYNDESTEDVTNSVTYTPTVETALTVENTSVTVAYEGKTDTVAITVVARTLESIAVTTPPNKTVYVAGEYFDKTGMVVTGTYNDSSTEDVTEDVSVPPLALQAGQTEVTITLGVKMTSQPVTVTE